MSDEIKLALSAELLPDDMKKIKEKYDVKILPWTGSDYLPTKEDIISECIDNEVVLIYTDPMPKECIDVLSKNGLKLLGCARATPNNIDWKAAKENDIPIIHAPGRNAHTVAEYTVGMLLAICKRIGFSYHGLMEGRFLADEKDIYDVPERKDVIWRFKDRENPRSSYPWSIDVYDRTIGLVGLGAIGQNVALICKGMGMNVIAYDPYQSDEIFSKLDVKKAEDYREMLPECDFVSVHLNVTEDTRSMIDGEWFDLMRSDAYFINTARAAVVDQKALIEALENKKIAFAAIDVMWDEPAPKNHPLLKKDNVLITPHMGGISSDVKKWASQMVTDELMRYANKEKNIRVWTRLE